MANAGPDRSLTLPINTLTLVGTATPASPSSTASSYSYDEHGNVKTLWQQLPGNVPLKRTDYVYDLISGKVNYVFYQYGQADMFAHRYAYDADNRLTRVLTSTEGWLWDKEAEYFYYAHGPLARVEYGEYNVQGADYAYTLQGWLKGINPEADNDGRGNTRVGRDAFGFLLGYYPQDYTNLSGVIIGESQWSRYEQQWAGPVGLYNGNIAHMTTALTAQGGKGISEAATQGQLYRYDQLNRLRANRTLTGFANASGFAARPSGPAAFDSDFSYDANGNLLTQIRRNEANVVADNFAYSYYAGTNRLGATNDQQYTDKVFASGPLPVDNNVYRSVAIQGAAYVPASQALTFKATTQISTAEQAALQPSSALTLEITQGQAGNYVYDAIGNLIEDKAEGTAITWTLYGKVASVAKTLGGVSTTVTYQYDASGNRVEKRVLAGGVVTTTQYVRDASGNVMAINENGQVSEQPIYGSSRLGQYRGGRLMGQRKLGSKTYELSNHLGNVLATVTDNVYLSASETWAKVTSATDYYPFGLAMPGRSWQSGDYRYGFNGKEQDADFANNYDYGFRIYNARIGKFLSVDPLTSDYPWYTPYQFAGNKPIEAIDIDGQEELWYLEALAGKHGKTVQKVTMGVVDGVNTSLTGTYKFVTRDAWKGETWKQTGLFLEELIIAPSSFSNTPRLDAAVKGLESNVINGDAYTRSKFASEFATGVATGFVGDKGLSKVRSLASAAIASNAGRVTNSVWRINPFQRGREIERSAGANIPVGNFPIIDDFRNGVAKSIKSLDLNAPTYQNLSALENKLTKYVDTVAPFNGRAWGGFDVPSSEITGRALDVYIPQGTITPAQQQIFNNITNYGANHAQNPVIVNFIQTP